MAEEYANSRENKDAKRAKTQQNKIQQTLQGFFLQRKDDKHARSQQTMVPHVQAKRLASGKRHILSWEAARIRKERADPAKKEAEKVAEEDGDKSKTISFSPGNRKPRASTTIKSVLRKVSRETIKTHQHELVVDVRVKVQYTNAEFSIDGEDMSLGLEKEKQNTNNSGTGSEANTAGGNESQSNSHEEECHEEMDRHYHNKIDDTKTFIDILYKEKGPSPVAMQTACQDLSKQVTLATTERDQEVNITGYSEDLIQYLGKEKESILELISYLNELSAGFKEYMEEGEKEREGLGMTADTSDKGDGGGETEGVSKQKGEEAGETK